MSPTETQTAADSPRFSSRLATPPDSLPLQAASSYCYRLFGLTLVSSQPLSRLAPFVRSTDNDKSLTIRFGDPPADTFRLDDPAWRLIAPRVPPTGDERPIVSLWRDETNGHYRYRYRDGAEFFLEASGGCVWARQPAGMSNEDVCSYLLGPVFALVLRLRGIVCLHASAARVGEVAVAFLGCAHAGKSTLAAAFSLAGYPALSDDTATLIPVDDHSLGNRSLGDHFWVAADSPRLNLWPRSAELLFGDAAALPRLSDSWDKRYFDIPPGAVGAAHSCGQRLGALYELGLAPSDRAATRIVGLRGHQALVALTQYARAAVLLEPAHRPLELDVLAGVVRSVPVRRVERAANERPQHVRDLILKDLDSLGIATSPEAIQPTGASAPARGSAVEQDL
jgi:hypothetical protein